jgi:hypothetical protein
MAAPNLVPLQSPKFALQPSQIVNADLGEMDSKDLVVAVVEQGVGGFVRENKEASVIE